MKIEQFELNLFADIVNHLITGNIIDSHTNKVMAEALRSPLALEELNQYLIFMRKKCINTADGYAYYSVNLDGRNHKEHQIQAEKQFAENYTRLYPITEWLRVSRNITGNNRVMVCGDEISFSKLLSEAENSTLIQEQLKKLAFRIGKGGANVKDWLNDILKYLVGQGYLVHIGNTGLNYLATGKWSVYYDESEYMLERNNVDYSEINEPEQVSFL